MLSLVERKKSFEPWVLVIYSVELRNDILNWIYWFLKGNLIHFDYSVKLFCLPSEKGTILKFSF